ncbi:MAG: glycosylase [Ruminococcaceae bacterium]|nr:glycosylase [Oscillospiraceae bacterium]
MAASWLKDAVFYEIYPQSFRDTNGDGIGDFNGIIEKLPYIKSLGCNAVWMNPCYDSPFRDAGYDIRDHKKVAQRYGTEEDLVRLFEEAHKLGIRILLDLVPGHTSETHPWFLESAREEENQFSDRYIWTANAFCGGDGMPFIGGEHPRDAAYIINFFKCQPALNYGYRDIHDPSWQQPIDAPGPLANREAMKDIMRYWLDRGCDGFRVDMADSLVKNDHGTKSATMEVWKDIAGAIHAEYPEAALVSEWNNPEQALGCGFDMDFMLDWGGNGYNRLMRFYQLDKKGNILSDNSYFKLESDADITGFLRDYPYDAWKDLGQRCMITGNHDTKRASFNLNDRERRLAYAMILTMPGAPYIYYGDEIGMRYRWLPTKEGGYHRTGSRTPMQWDNSKNLGFSGAEEEKLYLPVDPAADAPTVAAQEADPDSMLNFVRGLIALRRSREDLSNCSPFAVYSAEAGSRLFAYKRGRLLVAVNPGREALTLELDGAYAPVYTLGHSRIRGNTLVLDSQSFTILSPAE